MFMLCLRVHVCGRVHVHVGMPACMTAWVFLCLCVHCALCVFMFAHITKLSCFLSSVELSLPSICRKLDHPPFSLVSSRLHCNQWQLQCIWSALLSTLKVSHTEYKLIICKIVGFVVVWLPYLVTALRIGVLLFLGREYCVFKNKNNSNEPFSAI